jgi:excisionase family DNA binding protein
MTTHEPSVREGLLASTAAPQPRAENAAAPKTLLDTEEVLIVPETCRVLRISRPTLYRHLSAGLLKAYKLGGRTVFRAEDVRRFMAGKEWKPNHAA